MFRNDRFRPVITFVRKTFISKKGFIFAKTYLRMEKPNSNPHDDFFKVAFSRQDVVVDYITQFLNPNFVKNIDLQSLTITNNSYITSALEEYFADVVWDCNYGVSKTPIKVTFLFEHKSYVPKYPHLQLLRYMLEIWDNNNKNKLSLTPIIPIIIYHNADKKRKWKYKAFSEYFKALDASLLPYIPSFEYQLTDLNNLTTEQWNMLKAGLLLYSMRTLHYGSDQQFVLQNMDMIFVNTSENEKDKQIETFLVAQLVYVLRNTQFSDENTNTIVQTVKSKNNMSAYDYLMQEAQKIGLDLGIEQGREQGKLEGKIEGKIETVSIKNQEFATSLIINTDFDDAKIAMLVGVTIDYVSNLRSTFQN